MNLFITLKNLDFALDPPYNHARAEAEAFVKGRQGQGRKRADVAKAGEMVRNKLRA